MADEQTTEEQGEGPVDELSDAALVDRATGGDFAAYEELVRRYQDKAYRLAWSLTKNETDAQDVVQEAFLNVYRKLDTFKGNAKFGSWFYRVVVNAALMRLRKQGRRSEVAIDDHAEPEPTQGAAIAEIPQWRVRADEAAENAELRQRIIEAVDELEPKYQTVFLLKEVEGLSLKEIGEVMDLTVAAVKSRLHRARLQLRASLERFMT